MRSELLEVGWRAIPSKVPREMESALPDDFKSNHSERLPFANLQS